MESRKVPQLATNVEESVFLTKVAQQAEQYEDMVTFIKPLLVKSEELTVDERNLVSASFKSLSDEKRSSYQILTSLENDPKYESIREKIEQYKKIVANELKEICNVAIGIIEEYMLKRADSPEGEVFFMKTKGDFLRYMAEVTTGAELEESSIVSQTHDAYMKAKKQASEKLEATNPVRLSVALNLSVFYFEIKKNPKEACQMAKTAIDEATTGLQAFDDELCTTQTSIIQLLRENLQAWTRDANELDDSADKDL